MTHMKMLLLVVGVLCVASPALAGTRGVEPVDASLGLYRIRVCKEV